MGVRWRAVARGDGIMAAERVYLVRVWDSMASNNGEWENECICFTREESAAEQAALAKRGFKTNVTTLKVVRHSEVVK